jgi:hypothetical protein
MKQDLAKQSYRGVRCLSCRQPIPLPGIVASMEASHGSQESDLGHEHYDRVFSLRCRACEREKPYRSSDIIDFEGTPTSRLTRSRGHIQGQQPEKLSRAANG